MDASTASNNNGSDVVVPTVAELPHLSLFSGIGGIDIAATWAGFSTVAMVEKDPFCQKVLARHWPGVPIYDDVCTFDARPFRGVDLVSGGFPCQDVSQAGRRIGITGDRSGLWGQLHRILCDVRPQFALVENVSGLLDRGMGDVLGALAASGFDAEWTCLSACAMGAPHSRERVFLVAYANGKFGGQLRGLQSTQECQEKRNVHWSLLEPPCERVAYGLSDRVDRNRSLGNSVSPYQVYPILKAISDRLLEVA